MTTRTRGRTVPRRRRARPWLWLGALVLVALAGTTLALATFGGRSATLVAERTIYDFGTVSMQNGEVATQFPLTVREPTVVTDVNAS